VSAAALDREKLVRVLGMLGSDHGGEVLAAARQAERLRQQARTTWHEVLQPALPGPTRHREVETAADAISYCLEFAEALTNWESNFVATLGGQRSPISPKQLAVLDQILTKARRAEARAA